MPGRIETKLAELGITLPAPMLPVANYVPFVVAGQLVFVSGQLPAVDGTVPDEHKGLAGGSSLDVEKQIARQCFVNVLVHLKSACGGDLDRVQQVVRLGGFIAARGDFKDHAAIMNGASDLAVDVFGDAGRHARTTIGVSSLPLGALAEVEGVFRIA